MTSTTSGTFTQPKLSRLMAAGLSLPVMLAASLLLAPHSTVRAQPVNQPPLGLSLPNEQQIDPPGRVARLSYSDGSVSFAPGDTSEGSGWTPAQLNRPMTAGDRLWTDQRARSELHIGSTALRMDEQTSLDFMALDDNLTQLRLTQGTVNFRVRSLLDGQRFEVDTPNLAFTAAQPGEYRIDVDPASNTTRVVVISGSGHVYGENGVPYTLNTRQQSAFTGTLLAQVALPGAGQADTFDAWAADRNRQEDQSVSARYIPREIPGYNQLDTYGDWSQDPSYGAVWIPRAVPANWAPYRVGHWSWIAPWGWTWIDDAPWGFAPFHYGRWAQVGPRWAWVPGRIAPRPVYAPALVAFVGGSSGGANWNISVGSGGGPRPGLGWFPLAPGEAWRPSYRASPRYVTQVNNNIVVNNNVNITNNYRYQRNPGAVTAVSAADFAQGRPVRGNAAPALSTSDLGRAQVVREGGGLPRRPDMRDAPRPAPATALPPTAATTRPVLTPTGNGLGGPRDGRRNDRDGTDGRPGNRVEGDASGRGNRPDGPPRGPAPGQAAVPGAAPTPSATPAAVAPAPAATVPAGVPGRPAMQAGTPDRNASDNERRARQEQERQQRAQREQTPAQAQPQGNAALPVPAGQPNNNAIEQAQRAQQQLQRDQQRQQRELTRQADQQRRQAEESLGQRALREQAQEGQRQAAEARRQQDQQQRQQAQQAQQQQRQQHQQQQQERAQAREQQQAQQAQMRQAREQQRAAQAQSQPPAPAQAATPPTPPPQGQPQPRPQGPRRERDPTP